MMRSVVMFLLVALVTGMAQGANRAEMQCTSPNTVSMVKGIVLDQLLPPGYAAKITPTIFLAGTRVASMEPTRYDAELQIAECTGLFTVDASAGIDEETARVLEVAYARAPDLLLMLQLMLAAPPKGRVYDFQIAYSSQIKGAQNYVQVTGVNEFKSLVTAGLLTAKVVSTRLGTVSSTPVTTKPNHSGAELEIDIGSEISIGNGLYLAPEYGETGRYALITHDHGRFEGSKISEAHCSEGFAAANLAPKYGKVRALLKRTDFVLTECEEVVR